MVGFNVRPLSLFAHGLTGQHGNSRQEQYEPQRRSHGPRRNHDSRTNSNQQWPRRGLGSPGSTHVRLWDRSFYVGGLTMTPIDRNADHPTTAMNPRSDRTVPHTLCQYQT
jgi:hypothetical protein